MSKALAYDDLKILKSVLPHITQGSRDYHRWKYNEIILETYAMAKKCKAHHWFSRKYFMSVMNIKEFMADSLGLQFQGNISNALDASKFRYSH